MKKMLYTLFLFSFSIAASSQTGFKNAEELLIPNKLAVKEFKSSPSGNYILFTTLGKNELKLYNLSTKKLKHLKTNKNLSAFTFSPKELQILYAESGKIISYIIASEEKKSLEPADFKSAKRWSWWYNIWDKNTADLANVNPKAIASGSNTFPLVHLKKGKLVFNNGKTETVLNPLDAKYYLHPSLSPDKTKILAYAYGKTSFVCNTNGKKVVKIGKLEAPTWLDNNKIIGTKTVDNGLEVESSQIYVFNLKTGKSQIQLPLKHKAMYPKYSKANKQIIYQTTDGKLYKIKIN